jgi:hypothetical protein
MIDYKKQLKEDYRMKTIIITNGSGGVGKDTFANILGKYGSVKKISSIDKIKEIARIGGWEGSKTEKDRKFLSDLKLLFSDYNNLPFNEIQKEIKSFLFKDNEASEPSVDEFLLIDIREPDEIDKIVNYFKFYNGEYNKIYTILIRTNRVNEIKSNMADANVENYFYDYIIENNNLKELEESVQYLIKDLKGEF